MVALTVVKKVENAVLYNDKDGNPFIRIDRVRMSYPFIGSASDDEDDDGNPTPRWRMVGMLPKETHEAAYKLINDTINNILKKNDAKVPADKRFLTDGDDKEDEISHGHWLVSAADPKVRPKARDVNMEVMDDIEEIDKLFVAGHWCHMLIRPWFFNGKAKGKAKTYPKRISAGLSAVSYFKKDKTFGAGRIDDSDAWGDAPPAEHDALEDDDGL
jgi:hypothetical protein